MRKSIACLMLLLVLLVVPLSANAAINADLFMSTLSVEYDYDIDNDNGTFHVTGGSSSWTLALPSSNYAVDADFAFDVTVNGSGQVVTGPNLLTVTGNLVDLEEGDPLPGSGPNLLTGSATQYWYQGFTLYFLIDIDSGDLADDFSGQITLKLNLENPGTWSYTTNNFLELTQDADLQAVSEAVPEPASLAIWGAMGIGALVIRRRSRTG